MSRINIREKTRRITFMGLLFSTALVLSFVESMLPVLPMMPPGVKLGLSNIVTMYALFTLGTGSGVTVAVLKSFFVFLMRGPMAASLSMAGGLVSVGCMLLLAKLPGLSRSYLLLSIFGAIGHNIGQLLLYSVIGGTVKILYLVPVMVITGAVMGVVTGVVLRAVMPYINSLGLGEKQARQ